jgi:hypothetical protein
LSAIVRLIQTQFAVYANYSSKLSPDAIAILRHLCENDYSSHLSVVLFLLVFIVVVSF